jgi:hypothetical protein
MHQSFILESRAYRIVESDRDINLRKGDKNRLSRINLHLDYLDKQLEKLEKKNIDIYWEVPTSVSYELSEIHYKLGIVKERMSKILDFKKARSVKKCASL